VKLLLDQNLSHRLIDSLQASFEEIEHVRNIELHRADDSEIWDYARKEGLTIVSRDSDFWERAILDGPPPKVIWTQTGNCTTGQIRDLLQSEQELIHWFVDESDEALLTLG
jgi:predicted nuclease of predicted toxin-antitoxin system